MTATPSLPAPAPETVSPLRRYFALLYVALCVMIGLFWPQVEIEGAQA